MKTSFHFYSYLDDFALRTCVSSSLAEVAQLVEHRPEEAGVTSSNLVLGTNKIRQHMLSYFLFATGSKAGLKRHCVTIQEGGVESTYERSERVNS